MEEYTSSYNVMVEAHTTQGEDLAWMRDKIADLEDRSRRNNIKIRGIPESIAPNLLLQYAQIVFSTLIASATATRILWLRSKEFFFSPLPPAQQQLRLPKDQL